MGKAIHPTACIAIAFVSLLALLTDSNISTSMPSTSSSTNYCEPSLEKAIVLDRKETAQIVDVKSELIANDAASAEYNVSDEAWHRDAEYIASMKSRLVGIATGTGYAISVDTSTCRVGIFVAGDSGYTIEKAFNADIGYIDETTGRTHTFTGKWHIDHRSESIPEGASFFTCFVPCWSDDGTDDGQGFHSGYDGDPSYESAGCTRLFYNDARYIYDNMPDGTPVIVY